MDKSQENAQFVMRNRKAEQPHVTSEGLQVWYDVKGKKDTDFYKDTLIDLSGNGRDATLHNFAYEKRSGYLDDKDGGLLFDDVDDKLVYPSLKDEVEYTSASRNLFDINNKWNVASGVTVSYLPDRITFVGKSGTSYAIYSPTTEGEKLKPNTQYVLSVDANRTVEAYSVINIGVNAFSPDERLYGGFTIEATRKTKSITFTTNSAGEVKIAIYINTSSNPINTVNIYSVQLEEGSTATPYTPYIPLPVMTYQYNGNILSYEADGTVKRVDDGKVIQRKGINLVRNGNFADGSARWSYNSNNLSNVLFEAGKASWMPSTSNTWSSSIRQVISATAGNKYLISYKMENAGHVFWYNQTTEFRTMISNQQHFVSVSEVIISPESTDTLVLEFRARQSGVYTELNEVQVIDLTESYGAGNEPTLEYIQAHPEEFAWTPSPNDLIEAHEIKNNLVGDMEDLHGTGDKTEILSGTEIFTDKADDESVVHVEVDGKSIGGGSGKNLVALFSDTTYFIPPNGTVKSPYSIELKSAWGNPASVMLRPYKTSAKETKGGGEYTLSFSHSNPFSIAPIRTLVRPFDVNGNIITTGVSGHGIYNTSYEGFYDDNHLSEKTFTLPDNTHRISVGFQITHGVKEDSSRTNTIHNVQLEKGSTATAYEPPAPNPDYPIVIHSLNDFDVVSSVGKRNLLPKSEKEISSTSSTINIFRSQLKYIEDEAYTFSFDIQADKETSIPRIFINNSIIVYKVIPIKTSWSRVYVSFNYKKDDYQGATIAPHIYPVTVDGNMVRIKNWKLERGSIATPWTPSPEDIQPDTYTPTLYKTNILLSEPLRSVGDVKDRLFRDSDGLWKVERNIGDMLLKDLSVSTTAPFGGSNSYHFGGSVAFIVDSVNKLGRHTYSGFKSSFLRDAGSNNNYNNMTDAHTKLVGTVARINGENHRVFIRVSESTIGAVEGDSISTLVSKFRGWVTENNVSLQYQLANPTIETLPQSYQDKLNNIATYAENNYLYTMVDKTNILPSYVRDNLKPNLNAKFRKLSWFWSRLLFNQLKIWNFPLSDSQLLHEYKMNKRRWGM